MNKMWLYSIDDLTYLKSVEVLDLSTNLFSESHSAHVHEEPAFAGCVQLYRI
ncbi:MAG: hypothetical protein V8T10_07000 [Merdibacter sp.]